MAINNTAKVVLAIGFAQTVGVALFAAYEKKEKNKTVMNMIQILQRRCDEASKKWRELQYKEKVKLLPKLETFKAQYADAEGSSIIPFASMSIDLLTSCYVGLGEHNNKRDVLDPIMMSLKRICNHFDKKVEKHDKYQKGLFLAQKWEIIADY
jgi:hypothetical protein